MPVQLSCSQGHPCSGDATTCPVCGTPLHAPADESPVKPTATGLLAPADAPIDVTLMTPKSAPPRVRVNDATPAPPVSRLAAVLASPADNGHTLVRPASPSTEPQTANDTDSPPAVSGYELLGTLGRGGMGVVYKARQVALNRVTALKMILAGAHAGKEEVARFRCEAEAVARLQHPNIVQIYEVGERHGVPFFSLEFVDGGSLQAKLDGKPMPARQAATLIAALARAVDYAHRQGIVHRDLKPANVLLTTDGTPKLTDFGLAKRIECDGHTASGSILGTPAYMSPEQAGGRSQLIGPPADIYALGAMLYEMIGGRPPFAGESVLHTLQLVETAEPLPPSRLQPRVPRDLETICLKCLQKEPRRRYRTAADLADDLDRFLAGRPIAARRTPAWERVWKWTRRRPAVAGLIAALAAVMVGGFFGMLGLWLHAEDERQLAENETLEAHAAHREALAREKEARAAALREAKAKEDAQRNYERALRVQYAIHMNLAQKAITDGQYERARQILTDLGQRPDGGKDLRGFEWYYLERQCKSERLTFAGITEVVFSRDGRRMATAGADPAVRIWDVKKGTVELTLVGHRRPVRGLAFSDDGTRLATASADGTVKLWNAATGAELLTLRGHEDRVYAVAFSPDGSRLASGSADRAIFIWDVATGKPMRLLKGHEYAVTCLAFSHDGTRLVSGGEDKRVLLWDWTAAAVPVELAGHRHWVTCVAFDAAGKRVASASLDETVILWDAKTGQPLEQLSAYHPMRQVAFSPGGTQLAARAEDGSIFAWDLTAKEPPTAIRAERRLVRGIAFAAEGDRLTPTEFDIPHGDTNVTMRGHGSGVNTVAFHPEGNLLASGGGWLDPESHHFLGDVKLWDLAQRKVVMTLRGHRAPVRSLAFGRGGTILVTGSEAATVRVWDVADGKQLQVLEGHTGWVNAVAVHPGGDVVASASADRTARLWDLKTGKTLFVLDGHGRPVRCAAFSPDGKLLATGATGGVVKLWDVATGQERRSFDAHEFAATAVAFSPDGRYLATAGEDQVIRIWDLERDGAVLSLRGHGDAVTGIVFSADGKRLFSSSADQTVKIWDACTGEETLTLRGHTAAVTCLALSGMRLASASCDQTVRVWEAGEGK